MRSVRRDFAKVYIGLHNYGLAVEQLSKALAVAPDDLPSQVLMGQMQIVREHNDEAIVAFRTALLCTGADPANPLVAEATLHLGNLLSRAGCLTAAMDAYDQLAAMLDAHADNYQNSPSLQPLLLKPESLLVKRGALMLQLRKPALAAEVLTKAYNRDRGDAQTVRLLAEALVQDKRYDRAQSLILEMASQPAQQAQLALAGAVADDGDGQQGTAAEDLDGVHRLGQEGHDTGAGDGRGLAEARRHGEAQQILASAMDKQPGSVAIGKALVGLQVAGGNYDQAIQCLAELLAADPGQTLDAARTVRQISAATGPDYHRQLAQKVDAWPRQSAAAGAYLAGLLANIRGDQTLARTLFEKSAGRGADFLPAYEAQLDMALVQRRFDDCQKILDAAAKLDDGKYAYFKSYLRGKYKISTGNLAEATRELEAAREAKGDYAPTLVLLAQAYLRGSTQALDRSNDAARVLLDAIRANPDNQELYQMLIGLLLQKNQAADASSSWLSSWSGTPTA